MVYDVETDLYEGSLPLLVELAKLNLVDIFLIKLVDLTAQFLAGVKRTSSHPSTRAQDSAPQTKPVGLDLNELAEPLPLLGTLVALKARGLLPRPSTTEEDEEVPVSLEELQRRLKEYEQFKTVAQLLAELHTLQHRHFTRPTSGGSAEEALGGPAAESAADAPFDVSLTDLMSAFAKVLQRATAPVYEVKAESWTVEMKVQELRMLLTLRRQVRFLELFTADKTKLELVVTFLALLELMRQCLARAIQEHLFGDIVIAFQGVDR